MTENNNIFLELKDIPFFYDVSEKDLRLFGEFLKIRELPSGRYVFKQGDKPEGLYFIVEGKVKVVKKLDENNEVLIETIEAPGMFGEMAIIDGGRRPASVVTLETFKGFVLYLADYEKLLEVDPELAVNLIRKIAHILGLKLRIASNNTIGII